MWLLRNAAERFKSTGGNIDHGECHVWSFVGHMTGPNAVKDWKELKHVMTDNDVQPIPGDLPYKQHQNSECKHALGSWVKGSGLPRDVAEPLCEGLLAEYACLGFNMPQPCAALQPRLDRMVEDIAQYHHAPIPPFF